MDFASGVPKRKYKIGRFGLLLQLSLVFLASCVRSSHQALQVQALPIDAIADGSVLSGSSVLNDPDRFVWGGSVIQGNDHRYHMLYSTWSCGDSIPPFSDSWVLNSEIAYAVSDYPDREFIFQKVILRGAARGGDSTAWDAQMVHNPHVKKFGDQYYLYYIGSKDPDRQTVSSKDVSLNKRNRVQQNQCIGVIQFNNFKDLMRGRYKRPDIPILSPRTRVKPDHIVNPSPAGTQAKPDNIIVVNPSVVQRPADGKFLLYFKGNFYDPNWRGVHGVAMADSPVGPFKATDHFIFDIRNDDGSIASGEDPFVWYHPDHQKFYVILKDFTGRITEGQPGIAILESLDGIQWVKPNNPFFMKKEVVLNQGDTIKVARLERPQLLVDKTGNPQVLYSACALVNVNRRTDGASFNVQIPLTLQE
ncbi:MAG: hypothetical protein HKN87_18230 [Saprospiraceae bacterium]|nr:hypothetical protein [Saprospiraceae bacterium]